MDKTPFWKQLLASAVIIGAAFAGWQTRDQWVPLVPGLTPASDTASRQDTGQTVPKGVPVIVAEVSEAEDAVTFTAIGTGFALRSVTLRAPSSGEITELNITAGAKFSSGDVLMRLEDRDERLAVDLAEARYARAGSERDRYRALEGTGATAAARIELEQARADLADRVLRAPFDGVAGLASVESGDRVSADDTIAGFDDRSAIQVEFDLPEALLGRVTPGLAVTARTPAVENSTFDGEISAIDSRVSATTRSARVRAKIDNSSDQLRPGASFSLTLDLPGPIYPTVPELALQFSQGSLNVWRVRGDEAEQVPVALMRRRDGLVLVDGPLEPGDLVIVEGTQRLRPGVRVEVLNTPGDGRS
jgi:multidrug efflux pump subunit AcrA (membrane-fusion protein)